MKKYLILIICLITIFSCKKKEQTLQFIRFDFNVNYCDYSRNLFFQHTAASLGWFIFDFSATEKTELIGYATNCSDSNSFSFSDGFFSLILKGESFYSMPSDSSSFLKTTLDVSDNRYTTGAFHVKLYPNGGGNTNGIELTNGQFRIKTSAY